MQVSNNYVQLNPGTLTPAINRQLLNSRCPRDFALAIKKASEIWSGNLFDNGFARVRLRANVV